MRDKAYDERQRKCKCLPEERRGFISGMLDISSDFSDGVFMGFMEEKGIDMSELECFSIQHDCTRILEVIKK